MDFELYGVTIEAYEFWKVIWVWWAAKKKSWKIESKVMTFFLFWLRNKENIWEERVDDGGGGVNKSLKT